MSSYLLFTSAIVSRLEVDDLTLRKTAAMEQARTCEKGKMNEGRASNQALIAGRKELGLTSRLRTSRINTSATDYNACLPEDKRPKLKSPGRGRGPYIRKLQVRTDQVTVPVTSHCVQLRGLGA